MNAGEAKGVPVQMKWLNASEAWKPAPRLKIESPWSGTNAAVKTRPSTSDRPYAAFEITIPPYECPTRIFGPEMPSSTARTIATSPAIDNRPSDGVTVVNPSFWSPCDNHVPARRRGPGAVDEDDRGAGLGIVRARGRRQDRNDQYRRGDDHEPKQPRPCGTASGALGVSSE